MSTKKTLILLSLFMIVLSACQAAEEPMAVVQPVVENIAAAASISTEMTEPTKPAPVVAAPKLAQSQPTAVNSQDIGPDPEDIPAGYNPLTGLPVTDPAMLKLPAVLVSITNFPPSSRPQAGLSFSPWVFEVYIAEGMTRFLATFYGDYPKLGDGTNLASTISQANNQTGNSSNSTTNPSKSPIQGFAAQIGPVRSGRLAYVPIRDFFQNSCLVYAGATQEIRAKLRGCAMVYGSDATDINSAMLDTSRLQKIAEQNQRDNLSFNYSGSLFTVNPPSQGIPAKQIDVYYSLLNQSQWLFDPLTAAYLKFEDFADGSGKFTSAKDRLNGKQLAFSNIVILYAEHIVLNPYIIDVKMGMGERGKAIIFRDGQKYQAFWSTVSGEYEKATGLRRPIHFEDANGNPFAFKPGQTWVHIVTPFTEVQDKKDGIWRLRFYAPAGTK